MELTLQQISYLLEVASKSPLTAEQIVGLIIEKRNQDVDPVFRLPTVRELFSEENVKKFAENKALATRVVHLIDQHLNGMEDSLINEVVVDPRVIPIRRWSNCGVQSERVIRKMFELHGCKLK